MCLNACSVLPEQPAPTITPRAVRNDVELDEVIVTGTRPTGKAPLPCDGNCDGTGGGGGAGGGSGSSGPHGGGPGSGGYSSPGTIVGDAESTADAEVADVGDRSVSMRYKFDTATDLVIKIEYTERTHKVEKISATTTGLVYGTVFKPYGDGTATYDPATNSYTFSVEFQFEGGTAQTGPIQAGPIYRMLGTYNLSTNRYNMRMYKTR